MYIFAILQQLFIQILTTEATKRLAVRALKSIVKDSKTKMDDRALAFINEAIEDGCKLKELVKS